MQFKTRHRIKDYELIYVQPVINGLSKVIGSKNAISNSQILESMHNHGYKDLNSITIRRIINHIRKNDLLPLLCANSNGYFLPKSLDELDTYLSSIKHRIDMQIHIYNKLQSQREEFLNNITDINTV